MTIPKVHPPPAFVDFRRGRLDSRAARRARGMAACAAIVRIRIPGPATHPSTRCHDWNHRPRHRLLPIDSGPRRPRPRHAARAVHGSHGPGGCDPGRCGPARGAVGGGARHAIAFYSASCVKSTVNVRGAEGVASGNGGALQWRRTLDRERFAVCSYYALLKATCESFELQRSRLGCSYRWTLRTV